MRKLIYHVASTVDHFIAHQDGSIDGFVPEGEHVTEYLEHLQQYDTCVMGRATYEFGYQYGLQPGQPAYPHMRHYIFSRTLSFDGESDERVQVVRDNWTETVRALKHEDGTDIYLCGGGTFAGYLLDQELIDELLLKVNPVVFGSGIKLFGESSKRVDLELRNTKVYSTGVLLLHYGINYPRT